MSEFKIGDEVWWFEFPDQNIGLTIDIVLKSSIVCEAHDDKYIRVEAGHSLHKLYIDIYRSKDESIDAMIKRLEEIKDE